MNWKPFARVLVRKSVRALKSAQRGLADGDYEGAVNRGYYAMFDIARAALLRAGVSEDKLPRTHNGVIELFRQHAVLSGLVETQLAGELSRTESLRIRADYTDLEIDPKVAAEVVASAANFRSEVERAFSLDEQSLASEYEKDGHQKHGESKIEDSDQLPNKSEVYSTADSLEDIRREARENWLRARQQTLQQPKDVTRSKEADRGTKHGMGLSLDDDFDR